jgi:hypothetical protein
VKRFRVAALLLHALLVIAGADAQPAQPPSTVYDVYVTDTAEQDRLVFIDMRTGQSIVHSASGSRYTLLYDRVLYLDEDGRVQQIVLVDGTAETSEYPLFQPATEQAGLVYRRMDWVVSPNRTRIAWTYTFAQRDRVGESALLTQTYTAALDAPDPNPRLLYADIPRDGVRAYPVAFAEADGVLVMDYQPDFIGDRAPMRQYASLFALDTTAGTVRALPGESGCFCAGSVEGGVFLRLLLDQNGFAVRSVDLQTGDQTIIPSLERLAYTLTGDMLIAPDGARAVYTLASISGLNSAEQRVAAVYVLIDRIGGVQRVLTDEYDRLLRPLRWTEDDAAVLYYDPSSDSTLKLRMPPATQLEPVEFEPVSRGMSLGLLTLPAT